MMLRFLWCRFTCSVRSTLQNAKHEPARGVWGHATPRKILKNRFSEIESDAKLSTFIL